MENSEKKALPIIALIIGILALVLSWVPIVNNFAAVLAIIGFIFAIIALILNRKNKKTLSIVSLVISIVAFVIVMATQAFYAKTLDDAFNKSDSSSKVAKKVDNSGSSQTSDKKESEKVSFKVGETADIDGVQFKINKVDYSQGSSYSTPDSGNQFVLVNVTITNTSDETTDYNPYDFKIDDNGNQTNLSEYLMDENGNDPVSDPLNSGSLAKGGSVTGTMVGQAKIGNKYKLIYTGNMFLKDDKVTFELN
ncbi:DUF4352 domain-containing protein [Lactococcus garvieae]|uniref:DUF4352 domain-containing protein n=1 Tax=Lactococcus garvieae TaxID=1363 RepID=UPI003133365E